MSLSEIRFEHKDGRITMLKHFKLCPIAGEEKPFSYSRILFEVKLFFNYF